VGSGTQGHPLLGTTHADYFRGAIPVTEIISDSDIAGAYEENTGHAIARLFKNLDPGEIPAVLVANHAPFTWGWTPTEASQNAVILETVAKLAYFAMQIDSEAAAAPVALVDKHFLRKHGRAAFLRPAEGQKVIVSIALCGKVTGFIYGHHCWR
jgi:L-ribulose-5-phosphate 4-epimerase